MPDPHRDVPVPDLDDPLFAPFWQGTAKGELRVQQCPKCKTAYWPPRAMCVLCESFDLAWITCNPRGRLFSWTIVGKATAKGFPDVPYVVAIVELDQPNVRVVGNVVGIDPPDLRVGIPLHARFVPAGANGEIHIIEWHPDRVPEHLLRFPGASS